MSHVYAPPPLDFNSPAMSCDCLAHVYGNAVDHPDRQRRYPSGMSDAEWVAIRPLLPVPAWLEGRGGQPGGYCHRQLLDAIRYLVAGGISWRSMPADFPNWARVYAFFRRWRQSGLIVEFHDRLRGRTREHAWREAEPTAGIGGVRGAAQALGGRAHAELADAFEASVPGLRDPALDQRGDDPVVDDHADGPPPGAATARRPALNAPEVSWSNQPRSARRFAFERTPSTFAATAVGVHRYEAREVQRYVPNLSCECAGWGAGTTRPLRVRDRVVPQGRPTGVAAR